MNAYMTTFALLALVYLGIFVWGVAAMPGTGVWMIGAGGAIFCFGGWKLSKDYLQ